MQTKAGIGHENYSFPGSGPLWGSPFTQTVMAGEGTLDLTEIIVPWDTSTGAHTHKNMCIKEIPWVSVVQYGNVFEGSSIVSMLRLKK